MFVCTYIHEHKLPLLLGLALCVYTLIVAKCQRDMCMYEHVYKLFVSPCAHIEFRHTCQCTYGALCPCTSVGKQKVLCTQVYVHACSCTQNIFFPHTGTWARRSMCTLTCMPAFYVCTWRDELVHTYNAF